MQSHCPVCWKDELTVPFCPDAHAAFTRHARYPVASSPFPILCDVCGKDERMIQFCPDAEHPYTRHSNFSVTSVSLPSRIRTWSFSETDMALGLLQVLHVTTPKMAPSVFPVDEGAWLLWAFHQNYTLGHRLTAAQAHEAVVDGDGNCFFRSVSLLMYGVDIHFARVRQMTTAFLQEHRADYAHWISENVAFDDYVRKLSLDKEDVTDEIPLCIVSAMFGVTVVVVDTCEGFGWLRTHCPPGTPGTTGEHIFLVYRNNNHYNACLPTRVSPNH